jgi:signal transduction histidine kinase
MYIARDITARQRAETALRELNEALERRVLERTAELEMKNKELETFAYSVSHDLKAPLRGIDGYGRLLLEDYADSLGQEGQMFLSHIRRATALMAQLIDDLLAYSRLERQPMQPVPIRLAGLVKSLLLEQQEAIVTRQAEIIQTNLDVMLGADPDGLAVILRNLLDNALKFTKEGVSSRIEIGCRQAESSYLLWVRDNGIGFADQFQERIFDIFQRLHRPEPYPGTGIGLALVRKAASRMGGRVWAESEPEVGTTFYLQIPAAEYRR